MGDSKKTQQQEQNASVANSIREAVKGVRGGMTERDTQAFLDKMEGIAKGLEQKEKTPEELAEEARERGEPDPTKTSAELVAEAIEKDKKAADEEAQKSGTHQPDRRLGIPVVTSQSTTGKRDAVETTAKKAEDDIKKVAEKK